MHISDGESKDYAGRSDNCYAWGWLSSDHDFNNGWDDQNLKEWFLVKLQEMPIVDLYRGFHSDPGLGLGTETKTGIVYDRIEGRHKIQTETIEHRIDIKRNGSIKISHDGVVYVAPAAVSYYVSELDYRPPDEVIHAVFNGTPYKEYDYSARKYIT